MIFLSKIIKETVVENPNWFSWLTNIILPILIAIVPVFILYLSTRSQIKSLEETLPLEMKKIQKEKTIDKMIDAIEFFTEAVLSTETVLKRKNHITDIRKALSIVVIYGNKNSVEYASKLMQKTFIAKGEASKSTIMMYALFVSYLKHDLTGEWVNPHTILKIVINDYQENKEAMIKYEENLKSEFKLKYDVNGPH